MKRLSFLSLVLVCSTMVFAAKNDTLMTIGGEPVMREEFEYIYNKNRDNNAVEKTSREESLEMFINYKLKVIEAKAHGMDTMPSFLREFNVYRNQLARPYLTDEAMQEKLYRQAYEHLKTDIEVSHVLISLKHGATPKDTIAAYRKAMTAHVRLMNEPFETVALAMSEDQSVKENKGYLGFLTGLNTVWAFEKAMYSLPVGHVSNPVRTNYGYHVIKVHSRRPARGRIRASHIMRVAGEGMSEESLAKAEQEINAIYARLKSGESFEKIARAESQDQVSARKGGDLGWFGVGRMVKSFEDAAFALSEEGEISAPIRTQFGWHIIKLTEKMGIEPFETKRAEIQRAMRFDSRSTAAKEAFVGKLKKDYKLYTNNSGLIKINRLMKEKGMNDSILMLRASEYKDVLVAFKDNIISSSEFIKYCAEKNIVQNNLKEPLNRFCEERLLAYEDAQLEKKHKDFRLLMGEYYGGLLLFEISSKEVWNKSAKDKKGLKKFFKKNKDKYAWDAPRYKGIVVKASDDKVAKKVYKMYGKVSADSLRNYIDAFAGEEAMYDVEKKIWKGGENEIVDVKGFKKEGMEMVVDTVYPVVIIKGKVQKEYPSSYEDVRGRVTTDYQNYLEKEWIKALRAKYPVVMK